MLSPEKLSAIAVMAQRGTEHEKKIAKKILAQNNISIEEAIGGIDPKYSQVDIPHKDKSERELIFQIYARLLNTHDIRYSKISPRKIRLHVPQNLSGRLKSDCETVIKLWRKEVAKFLKAFIQANDLFPEPTDDHPPEPLTEEILDILSKAESIAQAVLGNLFER